ncbi:molybdate ABC transporter substrate-binding protein [Rhizobium sp. YIM 134829]|uniref:molybdate ABC transporter substrate-binding protein n=1 Tax=Rhizobium sp. YIM 134829 TaxID=3390453 RepID=UPI0039784210
MKRRVMMRMLVVGLAAVGLGSAAPAPLAQAGEPVTVFAAASLKNALDAINAAFQAETGQAATASYAASPALAKQIEAGAPADLFISADLAWMDTMESKGFVRSETRTNLLGNRLVLIGAAKAQPIPIAPGFDLKGALKGGKLAMGAVDSVPAGKYGKAALQSLGVWPSVEADVAGAENVRAALLLVSRGEAPLGIVYQTDAAADPGVSIVGTFPDDSHPPILYPAAILKASTNPGAEAYLAFLRSAKAKALFEAQGFTFLPKESQ